MELNYLHRSVAKRSMKNKTRNVGSKNPMWKGDEVGYGALHDWVKRRKPKPSECSSCKKPRLLDLANISQKYLRDVDDFEWICRKCHMVKDGRKELLRIENLKRRRKHKGDLLYCYDCKSFKKEDEFYPSNNWDKRYLDCKKCFCTKKKKRDSLKIKLCPRCFCMTHTVNYRCGKCKKTRRIYSNNTKTK